MCLVADEQVRLLIVDDHPIWRNGVARDLTELGFGVVGAAGSGAQAVRIAAAVRPNVVFLDLNLPDLPGAEVTRQLLAPSASSYRPGPCRTMSRNTLTKLQLSNKAQLVRYALEEGVD